MSTQALGIIVFILYCVVILATCTGCAAIKTLYNNIESCGIITECKVVIPGPQQNAVPVITK